jgi:hypothetical protein
MPERRFPPPWTVEEYRGISYIVRDTNNLAVAYVYLEPKPGRRAAAVLSARWGEPIQAECSAGVNATLTDARAMHQRRQ